MSEAPKLVKRRDHKNSSFQTGRTIGEKREKLETRRERVALRKKDKRRQVTRIALTLVGFLGVAGILVAIFFSFTNKKPDEISIDNSSTDSVTPTIEVIDENASAGDQISTRMREYIGQIERDLKELDLLAVKAVIPVNSIRQINFYLDGYSGYVKTITDRDAGVTAEDISRMLKYLSETGVSDFEYIDVRIDGKAYWK